MNRFSRCSTVSAYYCIWFSIVWFVQGVSIPDHKGVMQVLNEQTGKKKPPGCSIYWYILFLFLFFSPSEFACGSIALLATPRFFEFLILFTFYFCLPFSISLSLICNVRMCSLKLGPDLSWKDPELVKQRLLPSMHIQKRAGNNSNSTEVIFNSTFNFNFFFNYFLLALWSFQWLNFLSSRSFSFQIRDQNDKAKNCCLSPQLGPPHPKPLKSAFRRLQW